MFSFFNNNLFQNFWANNLGDIFCDLTIKSMKWNHNDVDLIYYFGLEKAPEHYEFGSNKELRVLKKIVTQVEQESVNELGETVVTVVDVESFELDKVYEPIMYFSKGLVVKPC
jgi:hypothetical protein